jgi:hypothetical protein
VPPSLAAGCAKLLALAGATPQGRDRSER